MSTMMGGHVADAEEHERIQQALLAVKEFEGEGDVIGDSYTKQEYIKRRHYFLSVHPDYKKVKYLDRSATSDGDTVFYLEPPTATLSIEEVRDREYKFGVEPFLPFPTTSNTQTLDNYSGHLGYQNMGERDVDSSPARPSPPQSSNPDTGLLNRANSPSAQLVLDMHGQGAAQSGSLPDQSGQFGSLVAQQTNSAGPSSSSNLNIPPIATSSTNSTSAMQNNTSIQSAPTWQPGDPPKYPPSDAARDQVINDLPGYGTLTPGQAPQENQDRWARQAQNLVEDSQQHVPAQSQEHPPEDTPQRVQGESARSTPASALARSGGNLPIKTTANSKKRPAPADDDPETTIDLRDDSGLSATDGTNQPQSNGTDQIESENASEPKDSDPTPPQKKIKLMNNKSSPAKSPEAVAESTPSSTRQSPAPGSKRKRDTDSDTISSKRRRPARTVKPTLKATSNAVDNAVSTTPASSTPSASEDPIIERIARGEILPSSRAIAIKAQARRYQLLLANRPKNKRATKQAKPKKKGKASKADQEPEEREDFLPEHFHQQNFDQQDIDNDNIVRCFCKKKNKAGNWLCCDKCKAWHHESCIHPEAVPKGDISVAPYECQTCDPYRHRHQLQELRRAKPLP